ncbi:13466_t:CDS:2 [Ambispora leptoticha]|uniref:13466_t:CDS:1 n=1 Tax=Ambispora leptoticha TaxID=144679 RepID=A0A9N9G516_9GLOM|nr:13466_t:CDS:2 [Ambispora leptoticha]
MQATTPGINPICNEIIGTVQQAFIGKRSIINTALDIITVLRNQEDQLAQHWFLQLDQQKAHIVDSSFISEAFRVERGVRQGDPLSPLLYVLAINLLIQAINQNIKGISVNSSIFKVAAYADDLLIEVLSLYEQATNALVNKSKSTFIPFTANASKVELSDQSRFNLLVDTQSNITILGFMVNSKGEPNKALWSNTIKKIKNKIQDLSLSEKSLLQGKDSRNQNVTSFKDLHNYEQGGLSASILKDMLDARLLTILLKLFTSNSFWATTERETISTKLYNKRKISATIALLQTSCKTKGWSDSWKLYITAWGRFKEKILTNDTWPWSLEQIKISNISEKNSSYDWIKTKWLLNKKKDIFWRLTHRALSLGYMLIHIDQTNLGDCPNYPFKCSLSKVIWETTYRALINTDRDAIPRTLEDITLATNNMNTQKRKPAIWFHITAIYKIWCWYTQARWGDNIVPQEAIANIITIRIKHEIKLLQKLLNKKSFVEVVVVAGVASTSANELEGFVKIWSVGSCMGGGSETTVMKGLSSVVLEELRAVKSS